MIHIQEQYKHFFKNEKCVADFFEIKGQVFREFKGRQTIRFLRNSETFYIKRHNGLGWCESIRDLLRFRLPVLGAQTEWKAIQYVAHLGISTPELVGYGTDGRNPICLPSFIITKDIGPNISLEQLTSDWVQKSPNPEVKRLLIFEVAKIARIIHKNGINHRDFYLCHFLLKLLHESNHIDFSRINLVLIDLHRVQIRRKTPLRWIIKDLGGLYFSSMDIGLTKIDLFRFMKTYCQKSLREILTKETRFWTRVEMKANELYDRHHRQRNEK